jgi:hypothetical protein
MLPALMEHQNRLPLICSTTVARSSRQQAIFYNWQARHENEA